MACSNYSVAGTLPFETKACVVYLLKELEIRPTVRGVARIFLWGAKPSSDPTGEQVGGLPPPRRFIQSLVALGGSRPPAPSISATANSLRRCFSIFLVCINKQRRQLKDVKRQCSRTLVVKSKVTKHKAYFRLRRAVDCLNGKIRHSTVL